METKWTYAGWPGCNNLIDGHDDYPFAAKVGIAGSSGNAAIAVAYGATAEEADANAKIIAAAPDLYAALQAIRDSPQFRDRLENGIQQMVHAALAKARGE